MKLAAIGFLNLKRVFRVRSNIFYILLVPFVMVLMLGLMFGGDQQQRLGVVEGGSGELSQRLVDELGSGGYVDVVRLPDAETMRVSVERGELHGGIVIPDDYDEAVSEEGGADVRFVAREGDTNALDLSASVRSTVRDEAATLRAAAFVAEESGGSFEESLAAVDEASGTGIAVDVRTTGDSLFPPGVGSFDLSAPPLLLLYTFLTALTTASALVGTRQRGISQRMYATPTPVRTILLGELAGRLLIALTQALVIMLGTALVFGVDWGDPLGATAVLLLFSLAGGGAALLLGGLARTEAGAGSTALMLGLGAGVLGGTAIPLDSFGEGMRQVAHLTPHAWGYDAFAALVRHGAGVGEILPQLGVLAGFAAVLMTAGLLAMRRAVLR
ncbi:ABC transporter permease [Nocardiopsis quinghaiensis]|uniref:ABC transporter permease n=1 Tax=Nocardiopsis quinghaiensis TaxID=464995 RepID=UPI00123B191B|nr:ABC transporter permease [Nocardiopsis quinghaiensis]